MKEQIKFPWNPRDHSLLTISQSFGNWKVPTNHLVQSPFADEESPHLQTGVELNELPRGWDSSPDTSHLYCLTITLRGKGSVNYITFKATQTPPPLWSLSWLSQHEQMYLYLSCSNHAYHVISLLNFIPPPKDFWVTFVSQSVDQCLECGRCSVCHWMVSATSKSRWSRELVILFFQTNFLVHI